MLSEVVLIASALLAPPDLYFVSPRGEVSLARLAYSEQSLKLCVRAAVSERPTARHAELPFGSFHERPVCCLSASQHGVWTAIVASNKLDGMFPRSAEVTYFALREMVPTDRFCIRSSAFQPAGEPRSPTAGWSRPAFESLLAPPPLRGTLVPRERQPKWRLQPFHQLQLRLGNAKGRPTAASVVPLMTIAAVSDDEALAALYLDSNIAFFRLAREVKFSAGRLESAPTDPLDQPPASGAIEWTCVGVAQTAITRLASAFWFDDSVHLLSDDGRYERFRIENGGATRTRDLAGLPAPLAICQGKSELWILSEADGEVLATQVDWLEPTSVIRLDRPMGHDDFDKAAATLLNDSP